MQPPERPNHVLMPEMMYSDQLQSNNLGVIISGEQAYVFLL